MYQALYRKYRSQTFEELVGQEVVATTLRQAVASGKISHAYLFSGPRGTGKTSVAKIFAKAMNCPHQVDGEPCNQCDICHDITEGSLEDVIEIDAASNNGVDEIREIRDKSTYAPSRATYKVYIIDEVHMLSTGAFNALLKTLEEPTENVVFILATTELHKIPATILSRVQRFEFKAIKQAAIRQHMAEILDKESIAYEDEALNLIARQAEGGMRDALSILDQALSLSADNQVTAAIAEEITGSVGQAALDDYLAHLIQKDSLAALTDLNTIFDSGKSMSRFATDLLDYLRDILMVQAGGQASRTSQAFQDNLNLEQGRLFAMIDRITQAMPELKNGTQPKIYAEMMTIQLAESQQVTEPAQPDASKNLEKEIQVLKREVAQLKAQVETGNFANPAPVTKPKASTNFKFKVDKAKILTIMEETVADSEKSRQYLDALKSSWNEILDSIGPQDRALLLGSEPVLANSENAILAFQAAFNAEQAMKRTDLNTMFGNIMSQAAGFSPQIMAVPKADFEKIRTEFAQKMRDQRGADTSADQTATEDEPNNLIPDGFEFLSDKLKVEED
ncbi:DNA polymerase III subunits gamma and tau [Streptococcus criceti]|uniref:DNA-directed DNA polymerase n=1 Tax=Streptococcus criceti HS-6 TaxID=873449 RepID=G5JQ88_STRCG|nr:DNA polymerase III subunit gamma/tau [Streptococcus criceti]EHI74598.1 DNA polymerase III subunit gamma and tau [Streptococcus criceti HS-6]SUN43124.1 DNA polymerase III subunits gamma and tau [Streptococcus criceti]